MPPKATRVFSVLSPEFEQHCLTHGIYKPGYKNLDGDTIQPSNLKEIRTAIFTLRYPIPTEEEFRRFQDDVNGLTKATVSTIIISVLRKDIRKDIPFGQEENFSNLAPIIPLVQDEPRLANPKPDYYEGSPALSIEAKVREELAKTIVPTPKNDYPVIPNFFMAFKRVGGSYPSFYRQSMYDGALGARAMQSILSYGKGQHTVDHAARVLTATFDGHLMAIYAHHVRVSSSDPTKLDYHTTRLGMWLITQDYDQFRAAVNALRNSQALTTKWREEVIAEANLMATRGGSGK